jgi:hypothetical protein
MVFYGILIALPFIMKFYILMKKLINFVSEYYIESAAEHKINQELFYGQASNEPGFAMFDGLVQYIEHIIDGRANALIICGPPGMSKTYTLRRTFHFKGLLPKRQYVIEKGATLGLPGTFALLYRHRNKILVLDDFDTPLQNPDTINLLKSVTDTYEKRIVSLPREKMIQTYGDGGPPESGLPEKFEFKGQVIIITNLNKRDIDYALLSRAPAYEVKFDSKQILISLDNLYKFVNPKVDNKIKEEVFNYIKLLYRNDPSINVTFRGFKSAVDARIGNPIGWREMVHVIVGYTGGVVKENETIKNYLEHQELISEIDPFFIIMGAYFLIFGALAWLASTYESGISKHPEFAKLINKFDHEIDLCQRTFSGEVATRSRTQDNYGRIQDKIEYQEYVDRPKLTRCVYEARERFLVNTIKLIKKTGDEEFCKYNKHKEKCYQVTSKLRQYAEEELKDVKQMIKVMDKRRLTKPQFKRLQKVLN